MKKEILENTGSGSPFWLHPFLSAMSLQPLLLKLRPVFVNLTAMLTEVCPDTPTVLSVWNVQRPTPRKPDR